MGKDWIRLGHLKYLITHFNRRNKDVVYRSRTKHEALQPLMVRILDR